MGRGNLNSVERFYVAKFTLQTKVKVTNSTLNEEVIS